MSPDRPLLAARDLAAPLAWCQGVPVSAALFLAEVALLAERLPAAGRPVNLCQDRYHFALGLAAALLRGQTSLMPPNALPETLRLLHAGPGPVYALLDDVALDVGGLPRVVVERTADAVPARHVPLIPAGFEAVCLLTSGSTGPPQPHAKRWGALVDNIAAEAERLAELLGRPDLHGLNVLATVPAQHSYGFESTVLLALLGGATFDAGRPFYPADIADALAQLPAPRALVTTPFHLKTLLRAGVALPPVALVLSATAPLSPRRRRRPKPCSAGGWWKSTAAPKPARWPRAAPRPARPGARWARCACGANGMSTASASWCRVATCSKRRRWPTCWSSRTPSTSACSAAPTT